MKKLLDFITPKIDKLLHHWQWTVLFLFLLSITTIINFLFNAELSEYYAFWICFATALGKEVIHDWIQGKGTPEWKDFFAGMFTPTLYIIFKFFIWNL